MPIKILTKPPDAEERKQLEAQVEAANQKGEILLIFSVTAFAKALGSTLLIVILPFLIVNRSVAALPIQSQVVVKIMCYSLSLVFFLWWYTDLMAVEATLDEKRRITYNVEAVGDCLFALGMFLMLLGSWVEDDVTFYSGIFLATSAQYFFIRAGLIQWKVRKGKT